MSTFAMINSASSGLPSCSLSAMSASEMREYEKLIMRTPVLMTLWRRRTIRVYVPSAENLSENVVSVWLKLFRLPVRTANSSIFSTANSQACSLRLMYILRKDQTPLDYVLGDQGPNFQNFLKTFSKDLPMSDDIGIPKKFSFPNFWLLSLRFQRTPSFLSS